MVVEEGASDVVDEPVPKGVFKHHQQNGVFQHHQWAQAYNLVEQSLFCKLTAKMGFLGEREDGILVVY